MRKPRDWEWKKIPETPENRLEIEDMMLKEEDEEVESLYKDVPGLREYVEAGHTGQDFVDNYETLGFDISPFQYHLCRFKWNIDQLRTIKEPGDWKPIPYEEVVIPESLALKIVGDVIPEKYKTWGFALYFTDNDFGCQMEMIGSIIGERYKKEFFDVVKSICEFEEVYVIAEEYCNQQLGKYFDEGKLKELVSRLYPSGEILCDWYYRSGSITEEDEINRTSDYLDLKNRDIKVGNEEDIRRWLVQLGWTEEYPDHIWCNGEVLVVLFKDNEIKIDTW